MPDIHETLSSPWPASLSLSLSLSLERGLVPLRESLGSVRRACNLSYSLAVDTDGIKHGVCIQCPTKVLVSLGLRENFREGFFFGRKEGRKEGGDWIGVSSLVVVAVDTDGIEHHVRVVQRPAKVFRSFYLYTKGDLPLFGRS